VQETSFSEEGEEEGKYCALQLLRCDRDRPRWIDYLVAKIYNEKKISIEWLEYLMTSCREHHHDLQITRNTAFTLDFVSLRGKGMHVTTDRLREGVAENCLLAYMTCQYVLIARGQKFCLSCLARNLPRCHQTYIHFPEA